MEVSEAIYQRMRAEREAVARRHRSQGQEQAVKKFVLLLIRRNRHC